MAWSTWRKSAEACIWSSLIEFEHVIKSLWSWQTWLFLVHELMTWSTWRESVSVAVQSSLLESEEQDPWWRQCWRCRPWLLQLCWSSKPATSSVSRSSLFDKLLDLFDGDSEQLSRCWRWCLLLSVRDRRHLVIRSADPILQWIFNTSPQQTITSLSDPTTQTRRNVTLYHPRQRLAIFSYWLIILNKIFTQMFQNWAFFLSFLRNINIYKQFLTRLTFNF